MQLRLSVLLLAIVALTGISWFAQAGGPFVVDEVGKTGVAQRWSNNTLTYSIDKGDLAAGYDNAEGIALVQEMVAKWVDVTLENPDREGEAIDTTSLSASVQAQPSEDITVDNYESALSTSNSNTYIIFDPDGSITEDVPPGYDKTRVVGLSQPLASDSSGLYITKGVVILNGYLLGDGTLTLNEYKAAVLHELGHLINLDHTQVNYDAIKNCSLGSSCGSDYAVPTMYPILVTDRQKDLKIDDKVTVSWIYPKVDSAGQKFNPNYGSITGAVFDADGQVLKGVNVIAMLCDSYDATNDTCYNPASDPDLARVDVRSMVSGVLYPNYYGDSKYYLYGLRPGHKYKVICESIAQQFTGASGFEPISNPPQGITDCNMESSDGSTAPVTIESAGQVIEMASKTIDVANPCPEDVCDDSSGTSSSSKCSLLPVGQGAAGQIGYLVVALVAIGLRRRWTM